jgi:hypothetical protein
MYLYQVVNSGIKLLYSTQTTLQISGKKAEANDSYSHSVLRAIRISLEGDHMGFAQQSVKDDCCYKAEANDSDQCPK